MFFSVFFFFLLFHAYIFGTYIEDVWYVYVYCPNMYITILVYLIESGMYFVFVKIYVFQQLPIVNNNNSNSSYNARKKLMKMKDFSFFALPSHSTLQFCLQIFFCFFFLLVAHSFSPCTIIAVGCCEIRC